VPAVTVGTPTRTTLRRVTTQPGQVEPFEVTELHAKVAGFVERVLVDIGDAVKEGELLAELALPEVAAERDQKTAIVEQALDRLRPGPVMIEDKKIAWPARLSIGSDGQGNSPEHIKEIMSESMEALIHHFKLVTEGFSVPTGQVYSAIESPRGELGVHIVSDGGTRPYRVHYRDPSFNNLQATAAMCDGSMISDVIAAVASIDPVMGGVDR
jgi:NADH:ubiquinone oxidoreductase subunit D